MTTVECNNALLFYEERGSGPPVLLITGTGGHTGAVAGLAERLATDHRTISYDRRGYGQTPAPASRPKGYLAEHVADAAALLRSLAGAASLERSQGARAAGRADQAARARHLDGRLAMQLVGRQRLQRLILGVTNGAS